MSGGKVESDQTFVKGHLNNEKGTQKFDMPHFLGAGMVNACG